MAKFRTKSRAADEPESPTALFHDLSNRSDEIKYLWAHQKEILDNYYENHTESQDVAIELPTGAGKTLVGLLIGEYRRRSNRERIAYLCPTRQLAKQVGRHADAYGIPASVLVGPQRGYDSTEFASYQQGEAIAVTTYSGVFNTNPRIDSPQVLIFDDAHSCETYVGGMWSLVLHRDDHPALFNSIVGLFGEWLPAAFGESDDETHARVELVPGEAFRAHGPRVISLCEQHLESGEPAHYTLRTIRDHYHACNLFLTSRAILVRPIVPPTGTHAPLEGAAQRLYMSATLGVGGELERIVGVTNIQRIPLPSGWQHRGTGRRLFLFPELSMDSSEVGSVVDEMISRAARALVLAPTRSTCEQVACRLQNNGFSVFRAGDIEDGLEDFANTEQASLVLPRYDGIDLPDNSCRLLVLFGKPAGTSLQERFLMSRVAASALLRDRILTRFTQGVGRCTRSDQDYAAVIVCGQDLVDFLLRVDNRCLLHPELQAELEFGIDNSMRNNLVEDPVDFMGLLNEFLDRSKEWQDAEAHILELRKGKSREEDPFLASLMRSAQHEIEYLYYAWEGQWDLARDRAKAAFEELEGDDLRGYRGWWVYLTGDAELAGATDAGARQRANQYFTEAAYACPGLSWLARLKSASEANAGAAGDVQYEDLCCKAAERIHALLSQWGFHGPTFASRVQRGMEHIECEEHTRFHQGLEFLGKLLGFKASRPGGQGDPDCVWIAEHDLYIGFEAKSEQSAEGRIGKGDIQQAQGHESWIRAHCDPGAESQVVPVLVSPRGTVDTEAKIHATSLSLVSVEEVRELCDRAKDCIVRIRNDIAGIESPAALEHVCRRLCEAGLSPQQVFAALTENRVADT